jgi:hypothetical protein
VLAAAVSLILNDTGLLIAAHGVGGWLAEAGGMPEHGASCATWCAVSPHLLITDTHGDPAHVLNPLVMITEYAVTPACRYYASPVGSLCVLSGEPARFGDSDLHTLLGLAPHAVGLLRDAAGD